MRRGLPSRAILALALGASWRVPSAGAVIAVPADRPTIQEALDAAGDGDTVLLADGVHRGPGNRDLDVPGRSITLRGLSGSAAVVIDAEGAGRGLRLRGGEGAAVVIEGLTIRGGRADRGGGILIEGASPTLRDCRIRGCSAISGGGIHAADSAAALLACVIEGNRASYGGGVYLARSPIAIEDSSILSNRADAGAGGFIVASSPSISRTQVMGNASGGAGGGFCFLDGSTPRLVNCCLLGNAAEIGGGFSAESALDLPVLIHCTISGNIARLASGGASCNRGAAPRFLNSLLWANSPESICGQASYTLWQEDPLFHRAGIFDFGRTALRTVGGEEVSMPDFVVDAGDYRLEEGSPALDEGSTQDIPALDFEGGPRLCGPGPDLGAFERCEGAPAAAFRRGDANSSGGMDISDAIFVLGWLFGTGSPGPEPGCLDGMDADDSGVLDITDGIGILGRLFQGDRELPAPGEAVCGEDPSPDGLGCRYSPCP